MLADRGVANPGELLRHNTAGAVVAWCAWWDAQRGVGVGLLAQMIRSGQLPPEPRPDAPRRPVCQTNLIADWLRANVPEVVSERGTPHLAAMRWVWRHRARHGKQSVTVGEHKPAIVAAVRDFEARLTDRRAAGYDAETVQSRQDANRRPGGHTNA